MSKAFLKAGAKVLLEKELHVVERQCADGTWVLRQDATGRNVDKTTAELLELYGNGSLVFREGRLVGIASGRSRPADAGELPVDVASDPHAQTRLKYARAVTGLPMTQSVIEQKVREVWNSISPRPEKPPGWSSVYRWARAYEGSEKNPKSLIACTSMRGNRSMRFPREVIWICEEAIESDYLTQERPTVTDVAQICVGRVRNANRERTKDSALPMPTVRLLKRLIDELPKFDVYRARFGRDAALKKFRNSSKVRAAAEILEHGEIDHTRLDIFVVDDKTGAPLGRPWLTVLIDVHARYVLGISISFEPPSRATVAKCLRHAFLPKLRLQERYPGIVNNWEGYGIFAGVTMDGGLEFHSQEIERIFFELDIEPVYAPRKTPWFKGKVERLQGTMNRGITATAPGKTFSGIVEKDDYDPKKHALMTLSALEYVVYKWIVDVYHQKTHRALGCSPAQMWNLSAKTTTIPMLADPLRFDAIVAGSERRVLSHKGIEFNSLVYNSPEMGEIRRTYGDRLDVEIRFDRSNLGSVIVLHPERQTPYRVPCLTPEYADGLTEWQHKVCKKYAKEKFKRDDPDAYLDAFLEINEIVRADLQLGKAKGVGRERGARWLDGKSADSAPDSTQKVTEPAVERSPPVKAAQKKVVKEAVAPPVVSPPIAPEQPSSVPQQQSVQSARVAPVRRFKPRVEDRSTADAVVINRAKE